ncbi:MAG: isoprenylcysteine carboxylmethyltransferase family protein [Pseudomonadota bacterium]
MKLRVPPPVVGLLCAGAAWGLHRWGPLIEVHVPGQRAVAVTLIAVGLAIDVTAVIAFFRAKTSITPLAPGKTTELVVSGWYRFSRNPMYLGMLGVLIGWVLWLGQPLGVLTLILFVIWITTFQIVPEEQVLAQKFGERYEAYRSRVRRWL